MRLSTITVVLLVFLVCWSIYAENPTWGPRATLLKNINEMRTGIVILHADIDTLKARVERVEDAVFAK